MEVAQPYIPPTPPKGDAKPFVLGMAAAITMFVIFSGGVAAVAIYMNRDKVAAFAKGYIGIREIGNNAGFADATFEQMMRSTGWKGGEAWCMYFVKAVYLKAVPEHAALINKVLTGSTQGSFENAASGRYPGFVVITSGPPRVGDIAIWQRGSSKGTGHSGVVVATTSAKYPGGFTTVEGNTAAVNAGFTGEGEVVATHQHPLNYGMKTPEYSDLYLRGFIRMTVKGF